MESPGTAPGSEPFIMGAFIAIVRVAPDRMNIGARDGLRKGQWGVCARYAGQMRGVMTQNGGFAGSPRGTFHCASGTKKRPKRGARGGFQRGVLSADQKPDLIISNSLSMRSRIWVGIGVCARSVVSIGFTSAATNCSIGISFIAASLAEA